MRKLTPPIKPLNRVGNSRDRSSPVRGYEIFDKHKDDAFRVALPS